MQARTGAHVVQPGERLGGYPVALRHLRQRVAALHAVARRPALAGEHLSRTEALREQVAGPGRALEGQPQVIGLGHALLAVPHRTQQRRVQRPQPLSVDLQGALQRRHGHVGRHLHLLEPGFALLLQRTEVLLGIAIDVERREERDIEIARCEAEGAAAVAAHDPDDVVGAERLLGVAHAGGAVVVRRQRQRPAAEHPVVVGEQLCRGLGGAERVEAIVHRAVDAHVTPPGRAHELPQACGADLRVGGRIERRLHVRQHRQLRGQPQIRQCLRDVRLPGAGADQPRAEAVRLAQLEADVVDRRAQAGGCALGAPQVPDPLIILGQRGVCGIRDAVQRGAVALARLVHLALAFSRRGVGSEVQRVVDHAEVVLVVEESRVGIDLRIDADPELHVALQLRRARHGIVLRQGGREREPRAQGRETPPARAERPSDHARARRAPCRVHLHSCKDEVPM